MGSMTSAQSLVLDALHAAYPANADIALDTDLDALGFDSLGLTAIVARAESDYGIEFSSDHVLAMYRSARVVDLAEAIERGIAQSRQAT